VTDRLFFLLSFSIILIPFKISFIECVVYAKTE